MSITAKTRTVDVFYVGTGPFDSERRRLGSLTVDPDLAILPQALMSMAEGYGNGIYTAVERKTGEPLFRMTTEWLDGVED